ncbi:MAG: hypothetical protein IJU79_01820 [Desulfovibrionaceae bacterium]|nr:hypothetical protein [Desulfovibrionaceae bacterium]
MPCICQANMQFPADLRGENLPFLPYLEYMLDENGTLDIETVSLQEKSLQFLPLKPLDLNLSTGTFWLRFTLGPVPEGTTPTPWLISLGTSFPGHPTLYVPEIQSLTGMQQWTVTPINDRHIFPLPQAGPEPKTCYIRLQGPPGLWFAPMLQAPQTTRDNWAPLVKPACIISLAVLTLLCLLRCLSRLGKWRIWTALFVGGALAAAYLGLPTVEHGHIGYSQFPSALAPGLTLMLLPHVARYMMRSGTNSRIVDAQLILLTLVGAAVTLGPLVPGFSWTSRFLELWPLGTILFIPTALWALFIGLPNAGLFLLICFLPPLFTACGVFGLVSGLPADLLGALPLGGVTLSSCFLFLAPNPPLPKKPASDLDLDADPLTPKQGSSSDSLEELSLDPKKSKNIQEELPDLNLAPVAQPKVEEQPQAPRVQAQDLQEPVKILLAQAKTLVQGAKETRLEAATTSLLMQAHKLLALTNPKAATEQLVAPQKLDLEVLCCEIYHRLQPIAERKGVTLGWYVAPSLNTVFNDPSAKIQSIFQLLVESVLNATTAGAVSLRVLPEILGVTPGLRFIVQAQGDIQPFNAPLALTNSQELATELAGDFIWQSTPQHLAIVFTFHLESAKTQAFRPHTPPRVIICSKHMQVRESLNQMLDGLNLRIRVATSLEEAYTFSQNDAPCLVIAEGNLATPQAAPLIAQFCKVARKQGVPFCKLLAITPTRDEWQALGRAGFTYALCEPVAKEDLRYTVEKVSQEFESLLKEPTEIEVEEPREEGVSNPLLGQAKLTDLKDFEERLRNLFDLSPTQLQKLKALGEKKAQNKPQEEPDKEPKISAQPIKEKEPQPQETHDYKASNVSNDFAEWVGEPQPKATPSDNYDNPIDWVGEPQPIPKKAPQETKFNTAQDANDFEEWVGEPTPIVKKEPQDAINYAKGWADNWSGADIPVLKDAGLQAKIAQATTPSPASQAEEEALLILKELDAEDSQKATAPEARAVILKPEVKAFLARLDQHILDAQTALSNHKIALVASLAQKITQDCTTFGFEILARLATLVNQAALAQDQEALNNLLPELARKIEDNKRLLAQFARTKLKS